MTKIQPGPEGEVPQEDIQQVTPETKEEGYDVVSSSVDAFIANQDNPEWRKRVCEEWYEATAARWFGNRGELTDEGIAALRRKTADVGSILRPIAFYKKIKQAPDMGGPNPGNILIVGADDKDQSPGNFLRDLESALSKGNLGPYEINPRAELGRIGRSWYMVGDLSRCMELAEIPEGFLDFEKASFVEPELTKEVLDRVGPFTFRLDLASLPGLNDNNWEPYKKVLQFFRDNHLNFVLTEKNGGIFTHHFERKKA